MTRKQTISKMTGARSTLKRTTVTGWDEITVDPNYSHHIP